MYIYIYILHRGKRTLHSLGLNEYREATRLGPPISALGVQIPSVGAYMVGAYSVGAYSGRSTDFGSGNSDT